MFPKPKSSLTPNTYAYESEPLVKPTERVLQDVGNLIQELAELQKRLKSD